MRTIRRIHDEKLRNSRLHKLLAQAQARSLKMTISSSDRDLCKSKMFATALLCWAWPERLEKTNKAASLLLRSWWKNINDPTDWAAAAQNFCRYWRVTASASTAKRGLLSKSTSFYRNFGCNLNDTFSWVIKNHQTKNRYYFRTFRVELARKIGIWAWKLLPLNFPR